MVYFHERSLFVIVVCVFLMLSIKLIFFRYVKIEMMCYKKTPSTTLHMRFGKCPRKSAYKKISKNIEHVLINAKNNGCKIMTIYSHLIRRGNEKIIMDFLNQEGMSMISLDYKPTPLGHKVITQVDSVLTRFKFTKVKKQSGLLVISLSE